MIRAFAENGRTKKIERTLAVHCKHCSAQLSCSDEESFWGWAKSAEVVSFLAAHGSHGPAVGAEITMVEKE
jgi:hypothetical protein